MTAPTANLIRLLRTLRLTSLNGTPGRMSGTQGHFHGTDGFGTKGNVPSWILMPGQPGN
jgi:hypothetical protein